MKQLWKGRHKPFYAAELQWRLCMPFSLGPLTVFAVVLSQVAPRKGRYDALLPAALIYALYANLMFMGRLWVQKNTWPMALIGDPRCTLFHCHGYVVWSTLFSVVLEKTMRCLTNYIGKTMLKTISLVLFVFMIMQVFILLLGELRDVGVGDYHVMAMIWVVLLKLPMEVYLFFPITCLLGGLLSLGLLASHHELIALFAAGISL